MKVRLSLTFVCAALLVSLPAFASGLSGESEVVLDKRTEVSQYLFYDFSLKNNFPMSTFARYFRDGDIISRGEFALGPVLKLGAFGTLTPQMGGTTDKEVMIVSTLNGTIKDHTILYVIDSKTATASDGSNSLYQRLLIGLNDSGSLYLRGEYLLVRHDRGLARLGFEYRYHFSDSTNAFVAPFYDLVNNGFGLALGFRF